MQITAFLSGEIHSDWRDQIIAAANEADLPVRFSSAVTDHAASDGVGDRITGEESDPFWTDHKAAKINAIRIRTAIEASDVVVVKFGDKYRQWNAAFDAGYAIARGKPVIVIHPPELRHALKEVDGAALAVAETTGQVVEILTYVIEGTLKR
jgi:YtoQ family protein